MSSTYPLWVYRRDVIYSFQHLRSLGVVGKFVEFFGPGVSALSIADRATVANMCPEFGATVAHFPVDVRSLEYLAQTSKYNVPHVPHMVCVMWHKLCGSCGTYGTCDVPHMACTVCHIWYVGCATNCTVHVQHMARAMCHI